MRPAALRSGTGVWLVAILAAAGVLFLLRAPRPLVASGDCLSEAETLISGAHFDREGFTRLHFLPVIKPGPLDDPPAYYLHYPPLPHLVNGALRRCGVSGLAGFRLFAAGCTLLSLVFWYLGFRRLTGERTALLAVAVLALSYPTFWLGDSLEHYSYGELGRAAAFFLGAILAGSAARRRPFVVGALALTLFLQAWIGFDYLLWSPFVLFGIGAMGARSGLRGRTILLLLMPVAGVALHLAQNAWALGGGVAVKDIVESAAFRTFAIGDHQAGLFTPLRWGNAVFARVQRFYGLGPSTILLMALAGIAALRAGLLDERVPDEEGAAPPRPSTGRLLLVLAAAPFPWFLLLPQYTIAHTYSVRHYGPAIALALAIGVLGGWRLLEPLGPLRRRLVAGAVAATLLAEGAIPFFTERIKPAFPREVEAFLLENRSRIGPGVRVLSDGADPIPGQVIAALWDRPIVWVQDPAGLEAAMAAPGSGETLFVRFGLGPVRPELEMALHREGERLAADSRGEIFRLPMRGKASAAGSP